ncbi:MAG: bifunctional diaminohydroxyphosphoribosylaminopyrimidine deaminase/5-amino-6-(5-phosphoribosylamino)uracil reductase RibD [Immundisolibacter sp.]|uniref:bifunctional diaminohydroxyphosphoribosylaminopyrimidine deaminase/5-amino-6-(5-phosphoribosylamino)uracil reductase RibD n=1 Tax=Immundisolibacter sp. TaxID=1934948 RepID=UPI003EE0EB65
MTDADWMREALGLAEGGRYGAAPNPLVGCLLVRRGVRVGTGFHRRAGEPHAEANALAEAGSRANGATAYVTLEPCAHHGRTPPCADALIAAGLRRVVVAMEDPNPRVAGRGIERLRNAGIVVECGLEAASAAALNPGFIKRMRTGRPYVRVKMAQSLDGRSALADGESRWITGPAARADVQLWRGRSQAIVTGIGTALADDPSLTVRLPEATEQPMRVVLDRQLGLSPTARLLAEPGETLVVTHSEDRARTDALIASGAEVLCLRATPDGVDLGAVLDELGRRECNEALVEAGPRLAGAFIATGLVDEIIVYIAPHLLGNGARPVFELPGVSRMDERFELELLDVQAFGPDLRLRLRPLAGR